MRIGYKSWLFLGTMIPVVAVAFLLVLFLDRQSEEDVVQEATRILERISGVVGGALLELPLDETASVQRYVEDTGRAAQVRITVVDARGVVLADSGVPAGDVPSMDNHGQRPELLEAGRSGSGTAVRHSVTLGVPLMYLARKLQHGDTTVYTRVSIPMSELSLLRSERRKAVLLASLLALFLAALGALWLSSRLAHRVSGIRDVALEIASGHFDRRVTCSGRDELRDLSDAINKVAEECQTTFSRLEEEGHLVRTILETMQEGVMAVSREGRVTAANQALCRITGYRGDPVGSPASGLLESPELQESLEEASQGVSVQKEVLVDRPERRVLLLTASPRKSGRGSVVVLHDTTEVHRLHRMRRDFVANVSHELRNPVATIQAAAETLGELDREAVRSEDRRKLMASIARQSERISTLVTDLLDLSRIESGQHELNPEDVDLSEAFRFVTAGFEPRLEERGLKLRMEVTPAAGLSHCDWNGLQTILTNLLDNAVKYTREGGDIQLATYRARGGRVEIQVSDSGPGMDRKHLPRLFERFYRVDKGRSRDLGGTGLGLAIVKHLAAAMDGSVGVRSHPDGGTTFTVNLPGPHGSSTNLLPPCHETDTESV